MEKKDFVSTQIDFDGSKLSIRRAESDADLIQIPALEREYFFELKKGDTGHVYDEKEVLELHPHGEFFLVEHEGELIGYTSVIFGAHGNPKIGTIDGDAYYAGSLLKPAFRGMGVSEHLNRLREQRSILYGSHRAITCLVANNRGSIAALSKAGFVITKTVRGVFSPNESVSGDRLVMTKVPGQVPKSSPSGEVVNIPLEVAQIAFEEVHDLIGRQRVILGQSLNEDFSELRLVLSPHSQKLVES